MFGRGTGSLGSALAVVVGFAAVSVPLVLGLHLARGGDSGEAIDGALSGCWFSLWFGLGIAVGAGRSSGAASSTGRAVLFGLAAGVAGWALLAAAWGLVVRLSDGSSGWALPFAVNSVFFALWGWAWSGVTRAGLSAVQIRGETA